VKSEKPVTAISRPNWDKAEGSIAANDDAATPLVLAETGNRVHIKRSKSEMLRRANPIPGSECVALCDFQSSATVAAVDTSKLTLYQNVCCQYVSYDNPGSYESAFLHPGRKIALHASIETKTPVRDKYPIRYSDSTVVSAQAIIASVMRSTALMKGLRSADWN
jgi:hypothetical protein